MPTLRSYQVSTTSHGLNLSNQFLKIMLTQKEAPVNDKGKGKSKGKTQPLNPNDKRKDKT